MAALDNLFGPQWGNVFDFTFTFENWIITLLPAALIIVATPFYAFAFLKKPVHCFVDGLFWAKLVIGILHICVNAIQAGLWANSSNFPKPSGPAAVTLSCVGTLCTTALILLTHRFSFRSSSLLSIYLSITFLLGIAKSRSFFLRGSDFRAIAGLQVVDTVILATLVILEEIPKSHQRNALEDLPENEKIKDATNEQHETCRDLIGGFWNRTLMFWMYPMLWTGFQSALNMSHLRKLTPDFSAAELSARFDTVWGKANKTVSGCFLKCAALTLLFEIIAPIVTRLSLSAFNFTMPWLMRRLLQYIRDKKTETAEEAGGLLGAFAITLVGLAVAKASTTQMVNVFLTKLRGLLSAQILRKSLSLRISTAKDSGTLALLSNDVESIISDLEEVYDLVAAIPEIGVALYLLSREVGAAFFLPISTIVAMVVCSHFLALRQGPGVAKWNKATQSRLNKMVNALSQIKAIKMMGLESTIVKYMRDERRKEINDSFAARKVTTAITTAIPIHFAFTPAVVVAGAIFWTRWTDGLNAITLFPTLVLVSLLSNPLLNIIMGWPRLGGVVSCFERIESLLLLEERVDPRTLRPLPQTGQYGSAEKTDFLGSMSQSEMEGTVSDNNIGDALVINSASLSMSKDGDALLKDVDLKIRRSSLVMVVGAVGTGKSVLLRSILGETILLKGSIEIDDVPIAFCDQQAWLPNTTVRKVIVGEGSYDGEWYQTILRACLLQEDILRFVGGDSAKVGSNGSRLSGGQKQRVSLARALYSRQPILILDDVFSALDRKTAQSIFQNLFGEDGLLSKNSNVTTILATHSIEFLNAADKVVVINGNKSVLTKETSAVIQQMVADGVLSSSSSAKDDSVIEEELSPIMKESKETSEQDDIDEIQARRGLGGKFGLYQLILQGVPVPLFALFVFLVMIAAFLESGIPIFLRSWVEVAPTDKVWFAGLVVLGFGAMLMNFLTSWTYAFNINPIMAFNPHDRFLTTVTSATVTFLTATGNGVLLNRASQDMGILSKELPHSFFLCFYGAFNLIGTTAMVISATKYAVIIMPVIVVLVYILQSFYLRTSRQMRYLDLEAKTPLYSQFTETLSGLEHVRAFGWKDETLAQSFKLLDHSQRAVYYMVSIQRWLLLMLDVLITIITLSLVALASYWTATTSQPSIGLGLLATTDWNVNVTNLINYWTRLETSLGAAERLRSFIAETPVEKDKSSKEIADWPTHGAIEFKNVTARYSSETVKALNDVSVNFETGQKVGIIGRTGSGKSSMLLTLLHMLDYTGSISIDGIEISDIPRHQLRRAMTTISQEAVELPLSIRANLLTDLILSGNEDTRDHDEEMKQTLKRVNLFEHVKAHGGLGALVSDMEFSAGQKQLFSLARAMMHQSITQSKIVLIDEATSSVDSESDMRVQEVMKGAFKGCTRLIIAHKVENIRDSDVVIEMGDGRIVSKGPPAQSQATL